MADSSSTLAHKQHARLAFSVQPDSTNLSGIIKQSPDKETQISLFSFYAVLIDSNSHPKTNYRYKETLADESTYTLMDDERRNKCDLCGNG